MESGLAIIPISQAPWGDVVRVFGNRGDPAGCWCQYFKITNTEWNEGNREAFQGLLREQANFEGPGPGLVAYVDGEPAGWCAVEPRTSYRRILTSRIAAAGRQESDDDDSVWAITCIVVRVGFRRRGIGAALVTAAVHYARCNGAGVLEGYPVDAEVSHASAADLYHGTVTMFSDAGFSFAARPTPRRAVMRLEFDRS